ncbi:MAG: C40 family peptidase [Flavobacteriaceae bacterium]|nr:C40 family peptidase [Flavobacteriaceae bacterium]
MKKLLFFGSILLLFNACGAKKVTATKAIMSTKEKLTLVFNKYENTPYRYGGTDSNGFDCSGFVQKAYLDAFNINIPRTTKELITTGEKVRKNQYKIGDLLFFKPSKKYHHVGIYFGNGTFIHSGSSTGVTKTNLNNSYWKKHYLSARRILNSKK